MDNGLLLIIALRHLDGEQDVLILIVMDNGLLRWANWSAECLQIVLILIVMDNGLLHFVKKDGGRYAGS